MRAGDLRHPVVVGLNGAEPNTALTYATREAARHGCGLRLVHAYPDSVPLVSMPPLLPDEALRYGADRVVSQAIHQLDRLRDGDLPIDLVVRDGSAVQVLLEAAEEAHAIVLDRHESYWPDGLTAAGRCLPVAAHARCPVISVPADWDPDAVHGRVVVGVDGSRASREALGGAFHAASVRRAGLVVIHAWQPPEICFGDPRELDDTSKAWEMSAQTHVAEALAGWRKLFPEVSVEVRLTPGHPARVLAEATESADLLVVGRHGGALGHDFPIGSVARALVTGGRCPVEVTPPRAVDSAEDFGAARNGQAAPVH